MKYLLYLVIVFALPISCSNDMGTIEIKWDRDSCERCRMVLSDRHFSAQVRGGAKNKAYLFDDIGCAVHWLKKQSWGEDETIQIWVTDYRDGDWLDARTAYYVSGQTTPMDFGFGAVPKSVAGSVDFDAAKMQMLAKEHRHIKKTDN